MSIIKSIENFNQAISTHEYFDYYRVDTDKPASQSELHELSAKFKLPIPAELKQLYAELGAVNSRAANESNHINIHSAAYMLNKLNETEHWYKLYTPGLIDYVRFGWGHDRWELDEFISQESQEKLNANYQVFGIWREGDILEGAHYFYFDAHGKFSTIYYHQDDFDAFMEALEPMLVNSPANLTLAQCVEDALAQIKDNLLNDE